MQQLGLVFQVLLLVSIIVGATVISWDRRTGKDRRGSSRGGRREIDGAPATLGEEPLPH